MRAPGRVDRRGLMGGAIALAAGGLVGGVVTGCIASATDLRAIDLDRLWPDHFLLIGRFHVFLGTDITARSLIEVETTPSGGYLLDRTGEVIWRVERQRHDVRLTFVSGPSINGFISLRGNGPLLVPITTPEPIVYFGDVELDLSVLANRLDVYGRPAHPPSRRDDAQAHLRAVAARLPKLRGRPYFNLIQRTVEHVPT